MGWKVDASKMLSELEPQEMLKSLPLDEPVELKHS
jgi:hypothetical protein